MFRERERRESRWLVAACLDSFGRRFRCCGPSGRVTRCGGCNTILFRAMFASRGLGTNFEAMTRSNDTDVPHDRRIARESNRMAFLERRGLPSGDCWARSPIRQAFLRRRLNKLGIP